MSCQRMSKVWALKTTLLGRTAGRPSAPQQKLAPAKAAPAINWRKWCCKHGNQHFGSKNLIHCTDLFFSTFGNFSGALPGNPSPSRKQRTANLAEPLLRTFLGTFQERCPARPEPANSSHTQRPYQICLRPRSIWRDARSTNRKNRDWWDEGIAEMDKIGDAGWDSAKKRKPTSSSSSSSSSSSWKLCCSVLVVQHLHSFQCPSSRPQATRRPVAIYTFQQKLSRKIIWLFPCHKMGCKMDGL